MSAVYHVVAESPSLPSLGFARMELADLPEVLAIEQDVYPHPWTRGNFLDSLYSGYETWTLREDGGLGAIAGYFLLMLAVDEAHLLNITVRRSLQGRGLGCMQLDRVVTLSKEKGLGSVLLEVRPSNVHALAVYQRYGFAEIGRRKGYYPGADNAREDAIVMRFPL